MEQNSNSRSIGNAGEDFCIQFLNEQGMEIVERNFSHRGGEIDIIFRDKTGPFFFGISEYLVFAEVKYRENDYYGEGFEAVTYQKRRRIVSTAKYYLYINHYPDSTAVRFDVLSVTKDKVLWIKDAFSAF